MAHRFCAACSDMLPTFQLSGAPEVAEVEEWSQETRLVPKEVWEDEPVERTEYRIVTEERKIPQVKALYPFQGQDMQVVKGEVSAGRLAMPGAYAISNDYTTVMCKD